MLTEVCLEAQGTRTVSCSLPCVWFTV